MVESNIFIDFHYVILPKVALKDEDLIAGDLISIV